MVSRRCNWTSGCFKEVPIGIRGLCRISGEVQGSTRGVAKRSRVGSQSHQGVSIGFEGFRGFQARLRRVPEGFEQGFLAFQSVSVGFQRGSREFKRSSQFFFFQIVPEALQKVSRCFR